MCGVGGFLGRHNQVIPLSAIGQALIDSLTHRGPDGQDIWIDESVGIVISHNRLAIIDLTMAGAQPMLSRDGRFLITYNGEVYNAPQMRLDLEKRGYTFRGHSDTEVIVEAFSLWGIETTAKMLNGIFAIGLWDREERKLFLMRDRMGVKPLFWGKIAGGVAFASELKALRAIPGAEFRLNADALPAYSMLGYVPTPLCIYQDVHKLRPGVILEVNENLETRTIPYALLDDLIAKARSRRFRGSLEDAVENLDRLLCQVMQRQVISDVPLGAFLSGGIDSSSIVAAMVANGLTVKTFTIKSSEAHYDESFYARAVAQALGTQHEEYLVNPEEALALIPSWPDIADEPFADASLLPTYFVCKAARTQLTVALSGDGGDELFSGYTKYMVAPAIWRRISCLPLWLRQKMAKLLTSVSASCLDGILAALPRPFGIRYGGIKVYKAANMLTARGPSDLFIQQITNWTHPPLRSQQEFTRFDYRIDPNLHLSFPDQMQLIDEYTYLPDNNLAKVDRASMALSLEVRVPLLDNEVFNFVWSLPESYKRQGLSGKVILKRYLERHVPKKLINRPKMGFGVPIDVWLRGPLRGWGEDLIFGRQLEEDGIFDTQQIRQRWQEHMAGRFNWAASLWGILMFQAWKLRWLP